MLTTRLAVRITAAAMMIAAVAGCCVFPYGRGRGYHGYYGGEYRYQDQDRGGERHGEYPRYDGGQRGR